MEPDHRQAEPGRPPLERQQDRSSAALLARALDRLLFDQAAVSEDGAGLNLVQVLTRLTESIDRAAHEMKRYNDRRDRDDLE